MAAWQSGKSLAEQVEDRGEIIRCNLPTNDLSRASFTGLSSAHLYCLLSRMRTDTGSRKRAAPAISGLPISPRIAAAIPLRAARVFRVAPAKENSSALSTSTNKVQKIHRG